jgi:hypothetical protein
MRGGMLVTNTSFGGNIASPAPDTGLKHCPPIIRRGGMFPGWSTGIHPE